MRERGIFVHGRLVSLSDVALSVIDYGNHDAPKVTAALTLARNVIAAQPSGATIAEVSSDWWDNDVSTSEVRVLPLANAEESADAGDIPSALVDGINAQVFRNGGRKPEGDGHPVHRGKSHRSGLLGLDRQRAYSGLGGSEQALSRRVRLQPPDRAPFRRHRHQGSSAAASTVPGLPALPQEHPAAFPMTFFPPPSPVPPSAPSHDGRAPQPPWEQKGALEGHATPMQGSSTHAPWLEQTRCSTQGGHWLQPCG